MTYQRPEFEPNPWAEQVREDYRQAVEAMADDDEETPDHA